MAHIPIASFHSTGSIILEEEEDLRGEGIQQCDW